MKIPIKCHFRIIKWDYFNYFTGEMYFEKCWYKVVNTWFKTKEEAMKALYKEYFKERKTVVADNDFLVVEQGQTFEEFEIKIMKYLIIVLFASSCSVEVLDSGATFIEMQQFRRKCLSDSTQYLEIKLDGTRICKEVK